MEDSQQDFAELYDELAQEQLAILQKIARGLTTTTDALYVANTWGLTDQFRKEQK